MRRVLALAAVAALAAGVSAAAPADQWTKLRRPLRIPRIAPGASCPVSAHPRAGAAYPLLSRDALVRFRYPARRGTDAYGSPWAAVSVAWRVRAAYRGPLLIRGRQLDGSNIVRFGRGQFPRTAQLIAARTKAGPHTYAFRTRLGAPGCYAYQVDGLGFSRVIVFEARLLGPTDSASAVAALRARGVPMQPAGHLSSMAFDYLSVAGERFTNPSGDIVVWQFPSFEAARKLLILRDGESIEIAQPNGRLGIGIFCGASPCAPPDHPPPHWFRNGRVVAVYLGSDASILAAMEELFGEQIAGV